MSALDEYPLGDIKFQAAMILAGVKYEGPKIARQSVALPPPKLIAVPPLENGEIPAPKYINGMSWKQKKQTIVSVVSKMFNVRQRDVLSPERTRIYVRTRAIIYHIFGTRLNMSTTQVGHHFNRDHTSILCGLKCFKADKWGDNYKLMTINNELDILFGIAKPRPVTFSDDELTTMCPPCGVMEAAE